MNKVLVLMNVVLTTGVAFCMHFWFTHPAEFDSSAYTIPKEENLVITKEEPSVILTSIDSVAVLPVEMAETISSHNIFDPERIQIMEPSTIGENTNTRINIDMNLVGTYKVGDSDGVILVQKLQGNSRQLLSELQEKGYEKYRLNSRTPGADAKDADKSVIAGNSKTFTATNIFRQFLKIGDQTINGYTLTEVTKSSATFRRKDEILSLNLLSTLESASVQMQNNKNQRGREQEWRGREGRDNPWERGGWEQEWGGSEGRDNPWERGERQWW